MSMNHYLPKKISLVPKKHHGFQFVLFILGCLLPPLAVALRFGIGTDFFINTILCICGYFPCHFHNFYIQNIRNNSTKARTPKWAIKAGFIDNTDRERRDRKNQWSKRFDERNERSTHVGQALEEGEEGDDYMPQSAAEREALERRRHEGLWNNDDETYYNEDVPDPNRAPNQERWHYPANFEGAVTGRGKRNNSAKAKPTGNGDRWERSRASRTDSNSSGSTYPPAGSTDADVPEWGRDYGSKRGSTKNKKQSGGAKAAAGNGGWASNGGYVDDLVEDDGWGGGRGNAGARNTSVRVNGNGGQQQGSKPSGDGLDHEF